MRNQPDILLIVLDTVRADRLSCYGYERETTPHLDAFAESGVLFERAISPAQWTIPAHASIFTGEYPTTHMTTQIYDRHSDEQTTLAEALHRHGYQTVGFCNNPLLGVVDNELDRGFEAFYNYGGAIPERPPCVDARPRRAARLTQHVIRRLQPLMAPIQNLFAHNDFLLRIAMHPRLAPLWQRYVNFKGNTVQSMRDLIGYLRTRRRKEIERPLFTFLNLMEAHLPYGPPMRFVREFAPYFRKDRQARRFMRLYNAQPYRWMAPITEPMSELQDRVLNDMYDAELAYQDHLLRHLLNHVNKPEVREKTIVVITSDHGEGLNHHGFVGHSLVAYDDLVRVPLIVRYPEGYPAGERVSQPVSTRRIFHTILQAAGVDELERVSAVDLTAMSLAQTLNGGDPEHGVVYTEAYTPKTLLALMEGESEEVIEAFRCHMMRRAIYDGTHKLISVGDEPDELFDLASDPAELKNLIGQEPDLATRLSRQLVVFQDDAKARRPANWEQRRVELEDEAEIADRLRGLGYIE